VRSWLLGVELSADRAGLLAARSPAAAFAALLQLHAASAPDPALPADASLTDFLASPPDRALSERLRELLRFCFSREYLAVLERGETEEAGI
jgi:hypothetical protein